MCASTELKCSELDRNLSIQVGAGYVWMEGFTASEQQQKCKYVLMNGYTCVHVSVRTCIPTLNRNGKSYKAYEA